MKIDTELTTINETQRRFYYFIVTDPLWDIVLFETTYTIISMHLLPKIHIAIPASQLTRILIAWIVKEVCGIRPYFIF